MMIKISSNDVPSYLRDGSLFETLDITDTEQFEVPADCYKQDTTVQTPSDLRFLIRSLRFWTIDDLPVNAIFFLITNDDSELAKISTEFPEYDRWWKMIAELKTYPSEETIEAAIKVGFSLTVVRGLNARGDFPLTARACAAAASSSTAESVEILTYLHQQGCPWDTDTTDAAAKAGNLPCLMYAHENGCGLSLECLNIAARAGQLASTKYLHSVGVPFQPYRTMWAAVHSLKLEVIQYLCESGCQLESTMSAHFAACGSLECLQYAHETGIPWSARVCSDAAENGHLHCLAYAHQNGCPWNHITTDMAAYFGHLECLKYAHSRGCSMKYKIIELTIQSGSWDCFWYLFKNGYISLPMITFLGYTVFFVYYVFRWHQCNTWNMISMMCRYMECTLKLFKPRILSNTTQKYLFQMSSVIQSIVGVVMVYQWISWFFG